LKQRIGELKQMNFGGFVVGTVKPLAKLFTPTKKVHNQNQLFWFRGVGTKQKEKRDRIENEMCTV
jgi:hypothetical protein